MRFEQFVENLFQQRCKGWQAFELVQQITGAPVQGFANCRLLVLEHIAFDGFAGQGDTAFFHQLLAQRNREESQEIIIFRGIVEACLQSVCQCLPIGEFLHAIVGRIEKHAVVIRPCAEHEAARQRHGLLLVGVEQDAFGQHRRGLLVAQRLRSELRVGKPVEVFAVETVCRTEVNVQAG
ncbi:hypothetical protein WKQ99_14765 [Pseudomonas atacamensis]|uniref:hypothetical protein n=1 Tax=Pseudomonas atacamensis TaxID=2565368 RepID=UPI0030CBA13E